VCLAAFWSTAVQVAAQGAAAGEGAAGAATSDGSQARARAHFATAMEHYRARRYREAIHEFRLSIAELPSADVWFNIGRAHEQLGQYALAIEHYRLYLRDRVDAPDAAEVEQTIAKLESQRRTSHALDSEAGRDGSLAIEASEPGTLLLLDGEKLGMSPMERVLRISSGRHRLEASRPGHMPFRADVEVQPGALSMAYVQLRPVAQRAPPPERFWSWIAAGASACALLTSGALGLIALDRRDAGRWQDARRSAIASDVALGAGLGLAIGAALLYFVEDRADESPPEGARATD
jgi:hypothetical protein